MTKELAQWRSLSEAERQALIAAADKRMRKRYPPRKKRGRRRPPPPIQNRTSSPFWFLTGGI